MERYKYDTHTITANSDNAEVSFEITERTDTQTGVKEYSLKDFIDGIGLKTVDPNADPLVEIFRNPVVGSYKSCNLIHYSELRKDYFMDVYNLVKMMKQASIVGNVVSGMDYNLTEPNTLTIHGNINVRDTALLAGFKIDNEQFTSLANTLGISNILLNGVDGSGHLAGGNVAWDANGAGHVAGGNIIWDLLGNLLIRGKFESNKNGNRVVIDPQGSIRMINAANEEIMTIYTEYGTPYIKFKYKELDVVHEVTLSSAGLEIISDGSLIFSINSKSGEMFINPNTIPTSRDNIIAGGIYRTGETLKVKVGI